MTFHLHKPIKNKPFEGFQWPWSGEQVWTTESFINVTTIMCPLRVLKSEMNLTHQYWLFLTKHPKWKVFLDVRSGMCFKSQPIQRVK